MEGLRATGVTLADQLGKVLPHAFRLPGGDKTLTQAIRAIRQPAIAVLVQSAKTSDWDRALTLLRKLVQLIP
jgi:hypothetical protein